MSRIDELLSRTCPEGVPYLPIGSPSVSTQVISGATPRSGVSDYWDDGTIPWMSSGEVNKGTVWATEKLITEAAYRATSTKMVPAGTVVIALAGQGKTRGTVARTRLALCTNQSLASIVTGPAINPDFLFYFLRTQYQQLREVSSGDGTRGGLNLQMIRAYRVPVPPLEVQGEIVRVLDTFTELEAELEAELEVELATRRRHHNYLRRSILDGTKSFDALPLEQIAVFKNAKAHERLVDPNGDVALLTARFISSDGRFARYVNHEDVLTPARAGDVAMVMSDLPNGRALSRCFYVDRDDAFAANQRVCLLTTRDATRLAPRFLCHVLDRNPQFLAYDNGQDQTHLSKGAILNALVPLPPIEHQFTIVGLIDRLDAVTSQLVTHLESELAARRKQYEHYRDRLLTFKELAA